MLAHAPHRDAASEGGWAPSRPGSVALDIGAGVGALVVLVPAELAGEEIEAEPASVDRVGHETKHVHTAVRERILPGGSVFAGVFQGLAAGEYRLFVRPQHGEPASEILDVVTVVEGQVTEIQVTEIETSGIER